MFQGCGLCISSLAESCVVGPGKDVLRDLLAPCQMALVKYTLTSRGVRTSVAHIFHYCADFTRIRVTSPCLSVVSTRTFYSKNTAEFADGWNILEPSSPWPFAANFSGQRMMNPRVLPMPWSCWLWVSSSPSSFYRCSSQVSNPKIKTSPVPMMLDLVRGKLDMVKIKGDWLMSNACVFIRFLFNTYVRREVL